MTYKNFSKRQRLALTWWSEADYAQNDGVICDGSIRSGKTISMAVGFIIWSMTTFNKQSFAICGRTIESLRRNVVVHIPTWLEGIFSITERRSENKMIVSYGNKTNTYYLFGGRDESSYTLIQGITIAGALFDEVALMPRSFVEQAMARCSIKGSKFWFNCNPESPSHWFYLEWIQKVKLRNMLYLHFTMNDNLSLASEIKQRYESLYSGVFYDRYIRGMWAQAEGLIYTMFNKDFHVVPAIPRPYSRYYVSCDYGTVNPMSMGLWGLVEDKWYRIREFYHNSKTQKIVKTDEEYYQDLLILVGDLRIQKVIVDPSAASFIQTIRKHGRFHAMAANNDVSNGIRGVSTALNQGLILFNECCKDSIAEFSLYAWDSKAKEDKPLKENDHAMDEIRYFVNTIFKNKNTIKTHNFVI